MLLGGSLSLSRNRFRSISGMIGACSSFPLELDAAVITVIVAVIVVIVYLNSSIHSSLSAPYDSCQYPAAPLPLYTFFDDLI